MRHKRRLTDKELLTVERWMDEAPQGGKPSIRQIAKALGVNKPSVIKALGGWRGIQRDRPDKPKKPLFSYPLEQGGLPVRIEPFTTTDEKDK